MEYQLREFPFLENLLFFCSLFPFASPYPVNSDTQPLAGFIAICVIFKHMRVSRTQIILLIFGVLTLFYTSNLDFTTYLKPSTYMWLYATIGIVALMNSAKYINQSIFNVAVIIYALTCVLTILFPKIMVDLQMHIVSHARVQDINSIRGVSVFATEPGLLAGLLSCFLFINEYFFYQNGFSSRKYFFNITLICFVMLCTKSGSAILFSSFYCLYKLKVDLKLIAYFSATIFILFIVYILLPDSFTRSNRVNNILTLLFSGNIGADSSIASRFYGFMIGLKSIFFHPFGVGIDLSTKASAIKAMILNDSSSLNFFSSYGKGSLSKINSSFGNLIVSFGIFGWLLLVYIHLVIFRHVEIRVRLFSMLFLVSSYTAGFPTSWLVLCLANYMTKNELIAIKYKKEAQELCVD